jgi:Raf kinase inhibitor-like YbhB/YbcL family protein
MAGRSVTPRIFLITAAVILLVASLAVRPALPAHAGEKAMAFSVSSPSFTNGGEIAKKFTCDATDVSPQLVWTEPPAGTKALALLVDDPDAPVGNWTHWVLWNLPPTSRGLPEGVSKTAKLPDGSEQGMNDFHRTGYNGPCPPAGKPHRYYFKLFALDGKLELEAGAGKRELEAAMKGHILGHAEWMGRYKR